MGSSTVSLHSEFGIQIAVQKTSQSLFEELYLKIRTYLRAAQRAFLPTCQELLEVSEPVFLRNSVKEDNY